MEIQCIYGAEAFARYLPRLRAARVIAVDLETTGLDPHVDKVRLVQLAAEGLPVLVVDCETFLPGGAPLLCEALSTGAVKVFQNAKFDLQFLMALSIHPKPLFDTMLAGRLLYLPGMPRRANLQTLVETYLGETLDKTWQTSDFRTELTEEQIAYAARDAQVLLGLWQAMVPRLREAGLAQVAEIEFSCARAVAQMEYHGICLDLDAWQDLLVRTERARDDALEGLYAYTGRPMAQTTLWGQDQSLGLNLDSNVVALALLNRNGIPVTATAKGDLYPYRHHPLVQAFGEYRRATKALSSFLYPIPAMVHPVTGRLHPQYGQISAFTGRMSCGNPNIQQIPRDRAFRACFTAPPGRRLVIADYSQIELRVAAQVSRDSRMLAAYSAGEDLHRLTASLLLHKAPDAVNKQDRQAAKAVNFGLIFGMGAAGLAQYAAQSYGAPMTQEEAERFRSRFFQAYEGIAAWHGRLKAHPPREGRTLTGRRFAYGTSPSLPELSNSPVQGTAADILKKALGLLADRLAQSSAWIVGTVHDEILLECPEAEAEETAALLSRTMAEAADVVLPDVPGEVEAVVCGTWADK